MAVWLVDLEHQQSPTTQAGGMHRRYTAKRRGAAQRNPPTYSPSAPLVTFRLDINGAFEARNEVRPHAAYLAFQ